MFQRILMSLLFCRCFYFVVFLDVHFRTIDRSIFQKIIHIAPIPKSDSHLVHLVAFTETGMKFVLEITLWRFVCFWSWVWRGQDVVPSVPSLERLRHSTKFFCTIFGDSTEFLIEFEVGSCHIGCSN